MAAKTTNPTEVFQPHPALSHSSFALRLEMTSAEPHLHEPNHFPRDAFARPVPAQPHYHALRSPEALPAAANSQLEDHWEGIPRPVGGVAGLGRPQELHDVHAANHGMVDYNPLQLNDLPVPYIFPDIRPLGIQAQGQPNVPENQGYDAFGHAPQYVAPGPAPTQGGFPHLLLHQVAAPGQPGAESIRRLASRYLHQPNSRVDSVCMEPDAAGRSKMVIILDVTDVL